MGRMQTGVAVGDDGVIAGEIVEVREMGDEERLDSRVGHKGAHLGNAGLELSLGEGGLRGCRIFL